MPVKFNKNVYKRSITFDICLEDVSPTMTSLLQSISSRLNKSSPAALLIGNIMTANVANRATTLQIALSINLKEKKLIQHFYNYGASCSYDGYLKFRTPTALSTNDMANYQSTGSSFSWFATDSCR